MFRAFGSQIRSNETLKLEVFLFPAVNDIPALTDPDQAFTGGAGEGSVAGIWSLGVSTTPCAPAPAAPAASATTTSTILYTDSGTIFLEGLGR